MTEQLLPEMDRPIRRLDLARIAGRVEAEDWRSFFLLCRALETPDLEYIVRQAQEEASHRNAMPWHRVSLRCARAELRRRTPAAA